jgi:hypothetical protein
MQALAASCEELRARTGKPPLEVDAISFLFYSLVEFENCPDRKNWTNNIPLYIKA